MKGHLTVNDGRDQTNPPSGRPSFKLPIPRGTARERDENDALKPQPKKTERGIGGEEP